VTTWVRTDAVWSLRHQCQDLHKNLTLYLSEDRDSSYYQQAPSTLHEEDFALQHLLYAIIVLFLYVLFKAFACLVVIFWSPWISLVECSCLSFALVVLCVQVRNYFLFSMMSMRVVSGKSKPMWVGLRTGILRPRALMDGILF
jgi:hypothetical protein